MPVQLIRNVRQRQPLKAAKIDYSNPISKEIVFAFEAGAGQRDLVTGVAGESIGSGVSPSAGNFGRNFDFSGSQANRSCSFGVHLGLMGATEATWDIMIYFDAGNASAHFFGQWDNNQKWLLQNNAGQLVWVPAQDDSLGRRRFNSSAPVFGSAGWYRVILSWSGGSSAVMMINRSVVGATQVNSNGVVIGPANTADYLQIGMVNGGSPLAGNVLFARAWRRGLSLSEMFSLNDNPWQIFDPETIPLFWSGVTAQSATASITAAIRADRTASASLSAAIQSAATASATLSSAIQTAQSATSGLTAYVVASSARSSSASLSAAISDARTATSSLSAAVAAARTATAALDSAIQIAATASTGASAAIREAFSLSANLSGAVQASATASASLAAIVATTGAISAGLSAAVRAEQTASAGLSTVISASVWPEPEDVKQGVVYGPQGFDYTGEFAGGGGPITRVMQGAEPETIIKTVVKTVYVDRPADSQMPGGGLVIVDGIQITPEAAVVVATRQATIIKAQEAEIASLRSENDALSALLMATIQ